jgi:hypothetical protein
MKKILFVLSLMLLIASSAYAEVKVSVTGDYWASGRWWYNTLGGAYPDRSNAVRNGHDEIDSSGYVEQDINLYPKISVDNTSLKLQAGHHGTSSGRHGCRR